MQVAKKEGGRGITYPQNIRDKVNIKLAYCPATSASSTAAITMCAKVDVKRKKAHTNKNIKILRSVAECVASPLRYMPIG